jgi:palmitoyltransferase ZDHHC3/7/25
MFYQLDDETAVEQIQNRGSFRPNKPKLLLLAEVCGTRSHPLCWIFPCNGLNHRKKGGPLLNHEV